MIQVLRFTLSTFALMSFVACTSAPKPVTDVGQLTQAAEQILSDHVYHTELFALCAALGGEVEVDAVNAQQNWLDSNGSLVAAADAFYTQQSTIETIDIGGVTLAPAAIRLVLEAREKAQQELALNKRTALNQQKTCGFRLAQMSPANIRLTRSPDIAAAATGLLSYASLDHPAMDAPRLAGGITALPAGKSYFAVTKRHQSQCADAYTLVMANQWPQEAYANFCGNQLTEILVCDWGKCAAKSL